MLAQSSESGNPQDVRELHCQNCGAKVYRMQEERSGLVTGHWELIDRVFTHTGNVLINLTHETYEVLDARRRVDYPGWLHALHGKICGNVNQQGKWQGR